MPKILLKLANHVKLNVKIVLELLLTVHNVSLKANIRLFYSTTVVFTHVQTVISKISTPTNVYVLLMVIILIQQTICVNHVQMSAIHALGLLKINVIIAQLETF